jgi:hypothetical protein
MLADSLAQAIAETAVAVDIRQRAGDLVGEIRRLLAEPVARYLEHPNWPSTLTYGGFPLEFSVSLARDGRPSVRYTVDVTDLRQNVAGNWPRYLECAGEITGAAREELWRLFAAHLDGATFKGQSFVAHGVGYGHGGAKRSTLYFSARGMDDAAFASRFERHLACRRESWRGRGADCLPQPHGVSYDFGDGRIGRTKFYAWVDCAGRAKRLSEVVGYHPDLANAERVFGYFARAGVEPQAKRALLLQSSFDRAVEKCGQKIFFTSHAWGLDRPENFRDLIVHLSSVFSTSLWELYSALSVFSAHKVQLRPSFVAVGPGEPQPEMTFYFSPVASRFDGARLQAALAPTPKANAAKAAPRTPRPAEQSAAQAASVGEMLERAVEYLFSARRADGCWTDFALPQGESDEWVTAHVAAALAAGARLRARLKPSAEWLAGRLRAREGWGYNGDAAADADATALACLAIRRTLGEPPGGAADFLARFRCASGGYRHEAADACGARGAARPDVTAVVLLAQMEAGLASAEVVAEGTADLISQQREDGGWDSSLWEDDLFATCRAVQALDALVGFSTAAGGGLPADLVESARDALGAARYFVEERPTPDEPCALGLWLAAWLGAGGGAAQPSVGRILRHLMARQAADGRWLSAPLRRGAPARLPRAEAGPTHTKLYLDPRCLITTATVIGGLTALATLER